jgi:hypothetical protein
VPRAHRRTTRAQGRVTVDAALAQALGETDHEMVAQIIKELQSIAARLADTNDESGVIIREFNCARRPEA